MKRLGAALLIVVGVVALTTAGCVNSEAEREVDELCAVLVDGSWAVDFGSGWSHEAYVYTFQKDGTYRNQLLTDFDCPPVIGRWTLSMREDGKIVLQLLGHNGQPDYYALQEYNEIRHDETTGQLYVSGDNYVEEFPLRHVVDEEDH